MLTNDRKSSRDYKYINSMLNIHRTDPKADVALCHLVAQLNYVKLRGVSSKITQLFCRA